MNLLGYNIDLNDPTTLFLIIVSIGVIIYLFNVNSTEEGFNKNKPSIILYYAPWCGHCKKMMPEWEKLTAKMNSVINVLKVNCDEEAEKAQQEGIQSFPTIIMYKDNKKIAYKGERTVQALEQFISSN